jgi:hypothetical protein
MSKRGARTSANAKAGQFNPDPEAHPKALEQESDAERSPTMEGQASRAYIRWSRFRLFGIPIPVGFGAGLKVGGTFGPKSKPKLSDPLEGKPIWDSKTVRFKKPKD